MQTHSDNAGKPVPLLTFHMRKCPTGPQLKRELGHRLDVALKKKKTLTKFQIKNNWLDVVIAQMTRKTAEIQWEVSASLRTQSLMADCNVI